MDPNKRHRVTLEMECRYHDEWLVGALEGDTVTDIHCPRCNVEAHEDGT